MLWHTAADFCASALNCCSAARRAPSFFTCSYSRAELMKAAQALALFDGLEFVTPEQIQELAVPVIAHRLVMEPQARFSGLTSRGIVEEVVKKIPIPA